MSIRMERGPEINVKLPRTVDWISPLFKNAAEGHNDEIDRLIRNGSVSPWDVTPIGGSALHVGLLPYERPLQIL